MLDFAPNFFFFEVKKINFWNRISSRLEEGERRKHGLQFFHKKVILMFQNGEICEITCSFKF